MVSLGDGNSHYGGWMGLFSAAVKPKLVKPMQSSRTSLLTVQFSGTESDFYASSNPRAEAFLCGV